jgi:large subunit ribosomal protein L9
MKVILLADVRGIGRKHDLKEVSDGYARNFLFPRALAKPATGAVIQGVESLRALKSQKEAAEKQQLEEIARALGGAALEFHLKTDAKRSVFGSVTKEMILKELRARKLLGREAVEVKLEHPLKEFGDHQVAIDLKKGVAGKVTVRVLPQP